MSVDARSALEAQLLAQLTGVKQELAKLERQRETLEALLLKARQELNLRDVTRKNSLDRVLVENTILEALRRGRKPLPTKMLYYTARSINPQLRNTTFRSYLHRLKTKGLIFNSAGHGFWTAIEPEPASSKPASAPRAAASALRSSGRA
jgi:hypothetical protein